MAFRFRAATPDDLPALRPLMRGYREARGEDLDDARASVAALALILRPELGCLWVIDHGGRAVGYLAVTLGYSLGAGGRNATVDELYVEPEWRRLGAARRALLVADDYCRRHRVQRLHLEVRRGHRVPQRLYRRFGFADARRLLVSRDMDAPATDPSAPALVQ